MKTRIGAIILVLGMVAAVHAAPPREPAAPGPAKAPSLTSALPGGGDLSGKVVETMDAGGYTYVCLEKNGKKTWVAVPQMKVKVGATMAFQPGAVMPNFTSASLKRTFDKIVFSAGPADGGKRVMPPGHPALPKGATGSKAQVKAKDRSIKVKKAAGRNAYTVAEVHAKRAKLDKKKVRVRAKVVKVNRGIMGRNWVHLQDGSGIQKKGTHNLVATSQESPSVGDVVTASGVIAKDRDFGGGYTYRVIMEETTFAQ